MLSFFAFAALALQTQAPCEVTVYNQGFAVIKQQRLLHVTTGDQTVLIPDIAETAEPDSVSFRDLSTTTPIELLEQNYRYDLVNPQTILASSVGKRISFSQVLPNGKIRTIEAILENLVSAGTQNAVVKTDNGQLLLFPRGELEVRSIPADLQSTPTFLWRVHSESAGEHSIELSYLAQKISWSADYVLTLDEEDQVQMQGWVTLNNQTGKSFKGALLKLLAGDVNRPPKPGTLQYITYDPNDNTIVVNPRDQFHEESLFEYHLYTLQRPTDIANKETKQVSFFYSDQAKYAKALVLDSLQPSSPFDTGQGDWFFAGTRVLAPESSHASVHVRLLNSKENHLGLPLPKGTVRVFQQDSEGNMQFLGQNPIDHTPKDEELDLEIGSAFDVTCTRRRLSFQNLSDETFVQDFEVQVNNAKNAAQEVEVVEHHRPPFNVVSASEKYSVKDSDSFKFVVLVPAHGQKTIRYKLESFQ